MDGGCGWPQLTADEWKTTDGERLYVSMFFFFYWDNLLTRSNLTLACLQESGQYFFIRFGKCLLSVLGKRQGLRSSSALSWPCYLPVPLDTGRNTVRPCTWKQHRTGTWDSHLLLNGLSGCPHNTRLGSPPVSSASPGHPHTLVNIWMSVTGNLTSTGFIKQEDSSWRSSKDTEFFGFGPHVLLMGRGERHGY